MTTGAKARLTGLVAVLCLLAPACSAAEPKADTEAASTSEALFSAALSFATQIAAPGTRMGPVPTSAPKRRALQILSDGCRYTERGIPRCSALLGAAYRSNTDPLAWERSMGHRLGLHRTYWGPDQVSEAVATARDDLAQNRLPWISFKLPHPWAEMREGAGDDWAREMARRLSKLDGPVWVAFHHEPEGDPEGSIEDWTALQARLAPLVRAGATNVAYTIILTGYNQLYGQPKYSLTSLWPEGTKIDLVGFDVYDKYGVEKNGRLRLKRTAFEYSYFSKFRRFARDHDLAWGLAETGQSDLSAEADPAWMQRTWNALRAYDGVAFTYFNSTLNSAAPWHLTGDKLEKYAAVLRTTPTL